MTRDPTGQKAPIYGPSTPLIRRFLLQLAGLGADARHDIAVCYARVRSEHDFVLAESAMALAIERSGRSDARDAVAGPLLQLVRRSDSPGVSDDPLDSLEPVAEPALAAVLALLVADLLSPEHVRELYAPFESYVPFALVCGGSDEAAR